MYIEIYYMQDTHAHTRTHTQSQPFLSASSTLWVQKLWIKNIPPKEEREGRIYGECNMETYITVCKIDSQWEFAV